MLIRLVLAASVLVSAAVHLKLWDEGYRDIAVVGPLFLLNAAGGLVIAAAVVAWRHLLPLVAAVGFGAATFAAFAVSTAPSGFLGVHEQWQGTDEILAAVTEVLAVVLGALALWLERRSRAGSAAQPQGGPPTHRAHLD